MKPRFAAIFILLIFCMTLRANDSIKSPWCHSVAFDLRPSYPFSSYRDDILKGILDMENAKNTRIATSIHLQYGFSFPSWTKQGRICPDAWQGLGTSLSFFGNPEGLGTPLALYAFQGAPIWKFSTRFSLYYEWNFGVSFGWRPCDGHIAQSNLIVGSRVNAYINLGVGFRYRLSRTFSLLAGLDLTHYSNGNTSFPNPGVNLTGLRLGLSADIVNGREASSLPVSDIVHVKEASILPVPSKGKFLRRPSIDLTLYGAWRKRVYRGDDTPILLNGHFAVAGLDIAPMWSITRNFRTGLSLDLQWDESTDLRRHHISGTTSDDILFTRPPFLRQVCAGLSARAELVMPLFSVNLGVGYNILGPEETRASYQMANLKVRLTDAFYLNIGYQLLNLQKQNNLMLGIGYTIR